MHEIFKSVTKVKYTDFIRCFIFDDFIEIVHIRNGNIFNKNRYDFIDKSKAFKYLENNSKNYVELIVSNKKMNCRSIEAYKLSCKELKKFVENELINNSETINSICYEKKSLYKSKNIAMCDINLNPVFLKIIQEFLGIKNLIVSFSCWPVWIISSYFEMFNEDKNKFKTSIFVIKNNNSWEIISLHNEKIVSYRKGIADNFDENTEIKNTITYISKSIGIDNNDIAIYKINEDLVDKFTFSSQVNMRFMTKTASFYARNFQGNIKLFIRTACVLIFSAVTLSTIIDMTTIFKTDNLITKNKESINSVDKNILLELQLWNGIDNEGYMISYDFQQILDKHMQNKKIKQLKKVKLEVDRLKIKVNINATPEETNFEE